MKFRRIILGAVALSVFVSCGSKQDEKQTEVPEYPTTVIQTQNTVLESSFPANIKGQEDIEIRPRIDGFIKEMYVDEGSTVKKGQRLFLIDSPSSEQGIRTATAAVESAAAQVGTAKLNVERIAPLAAEGIVSQVQLETYKNALEVAQSALAQAKAQEYNARSVKEWTVVTSPVDGIVGNIPYRLGSLVNSQNVLTTVANTKEVYVYFSINEIMLMDLLAGLNGNTQKEKIANLPEVELRLKNGSSYTHKGKISTIEGQVNRATGTTLLRANFPNPEGLLRSGFMGTIVIPTTVENAIVIPQKSTYPQQNKNLAYVVKGDSVVSTLIEVVPTPDGKNYVVNSGLSVGDRIVADGLVSLRDGMKIKAN